MPDQLLIEGDLVRHIRSEVITETRLQDFLPHIEHRPPVTLGLLPKTAIFVHWDESDPKDKKVQILAELAAGMYVCNYNDRRYQLSMPWTYFLFDFQTSGDPMEGRNWLNKNTRVYWAREAVSTLDGELMTALVPNCDNRGQICWGTTTVDGKQPLGIRVDQTLDQFYRTMFTHTNGAGSPWQSETGSDNWKRWHEESIKNPAAFLDMPEWDEKKGRKINLTYTTVRKVLGTLGDRSAPIEVQGRIPDMIAPATFGTVEEWLRKRSPLELRQLATGLANIGIEDPAAIAPPPVPGGADDIGGEVIG